MYTCVSPASPYLRISSRYGSGSGPCGVDSATSSSSTIAACPASSRRPSRQPARRSPDGCGSSGTSLRCPRGSSPSTSRSRRASTTRTGSHPAPAARARSADDPRTRARSRASSALRRLVHAGLHPAAGGDLRQERVGLAFLVERLVEQVLRVAVAELVGERLRGAVARDLVVLDALCCGDQRCVLGRGVALGGDDLFALRDEPLHGLARLPRRLLPELAEDVLEAADMVSRLGEVFLEGLLELLVGCCRRHLRQRLNELPLRVEQVAELVYEHVVERLEVHADPFPSNSWTLGCYPPLRLANAPASARSRCGSTVYFGSRADWNPALKTDQRRHSSPAQIMAPPSAAARRLVAPRPARTRAPAPARPFAAHASLPAAPRR